LNFSTVKDEGEGQNIKGLSFIEGPWGRWGRVTKTVFLVGERVCKIYVKLLAKLCPIQQTTSSYQLFEE
jgi:hypothetical protein